MTKRRYVHVFAVFAVLILCVVYLASRGGKLEKVYYEHGSVAEKATLQPLQDPERQLLEYIKKQEMKYPLREIDPTTGAPWKPRRHFGPFIVGSNLNQIEVRISQERAVLYFNDFFKNHPEEDIFEKYFGTPLPENATPSQTAGLFFQLHSVSYSSRYGGSICLLFHQRTDKDYEFRSGNTLWDLREFKMRVYVTPHMPRFNPLTPASGMPTSGSLKDYLHVEFDYEHATEYVDDNGEIKPLPSVDAEQLRVMLTDLGSKLSTQSQPMPYFRRMAFSFAHSFLHSEFQDMIGPNEAVDWIEISDNYVDIWTHEREPFFYITANVYIHHGPKMAELTPLPEYGELSNEYSVTISATHIYSSNAQIPGPSYTFEITEMEPSPTRKYGTWHKNECGQIAAIEFTIKIVEQDLIWDDKLPSKHHPWALPGCSQIESAALSGEPVLVDEWGRWDDLKEGSEVWGSMYAVYRLHLTYY